jgi:hypothetical protein
MELDIARVFTGHWRIFELFIINLLLAIRLYVEEKDPVL